MSSSSLPESYSLFAAALAVSLPEDMTFAESARRAPTVAAISVTRHGTQTAFPTFEEISKLITLEGHK